MTSTSYDWSGGYSNGAAWHSEFAKQMVRRAFTELREQLSNPPQAPVRHVQAAPARRPVAPPLVLPALGTCHTLRQGDTGSGKTTSINAELVQLHRYWAQSPGSLRLFGGDFKGELRATWGRSPTYWKTSTTALTA